MCFTWMLEVLSYFFGVTHMGFSAYQVCCLQPGAPIFGVRDRPAGEDQQG